MIIRQENGMTILRANEGKWLQKDESYSNTDIYLGIHDAAENWTEVDTEPQPVTEQDPEEVIAEMEGSL